MSPSQKRTTALVVGGVVVVVLALMQWNTKISLTAPLGHDMPPSTTDSTESEGTANTPKRSAGNPE
jgi:hypothetical protein